MRYENNISASNVKLSSILLQIQNKLVSLHRKLNNNSLYGRQQRDDSSHSTAHQSISGHWSRSMYVLNPQFHRETLAV